MLWLIVIVLNIAFIYSIGGIFWGTVAIVSWFLISTMISKTVDFLKEVKKFNEEHK